MDSLYDILGSKDFSEPPEVAAIKKYVQEELHADVAVTVRDKDIQIAGRSAALVNTLRLRSLDMRRRCDLGDKRLSFRIG